MPTKKKTEDNRSPLELEICATEAAVGNGEAAVRICKEAAVDLTVHASKLNILDQELVPKENELKSIHEKFLRILENSSVASTRKAKAGLSGQLAAALDEAAAQQAAAEASRVPPSQSSLPRQRTRGGLVRGSEYTASPTRSRPGVEMGAAINACKGEAATTSTSAECEKELQKQLGAASRELMAGMLTPLFNLPRTQTEEHNIAVVTAKAQERIAALAAAFEKAPSSNYTGAASGANSSGAGKQSKSSSKRKSSSVPLASQPIRVEFALYCPPGLDPQIHAEVLKLRELRLNAEERIGETTTQIKQSREILSLRKEEGNGTKAALKSAEKDLRGLNRSLNALYLKKEEQEIMKRKEEETAVTRKRDDKKADEKKK